MHKPPRPRADFLISPVARAGFMFHEDLGLTSLENDHHRVDNNVLRGVQVFSALPLLIRVTSRVITC